MAVRIPIKEWYGENTGGYKKLLQFDFNSSAKIETIGEVGQVMVSDELIADPDFNGIDFITLKKPEDPDIIIPDFYQQFSETVQLAAGHHYGTQGYSADDRCVLHVEQRFVLAGNTIPFSKRHIDGCAISEMEIAQGVNYLNTSALEPYFFDRDFAITPLDVIRLIKNAQDDGEATMLDKFLRERLSYDDAIRYPANTVVHYDNLKVHESFCAVEDTLKTLVVVRFCPK